MIKWKLLWTTLPFVLGALLVKVVLHFGLHFEGLVEFGDIGVVLTAAVFLIGFMLSGVMADYKESEKLPGELACALEGFQDNLLQACVTKPELEEAAVRAEARALARVIREWLVKRRPQEDVYAGIKAAQVLVFATERAGAGSHAERAMDELQTLRKVVTRVGVISRTGFLATGYALLETLVAVALGLMFVAKFKSTVDELILVPFVTLIFVYMLRLIKDVDDPFDYALDGRRGAAEVELIPLDDLDARWR